MLALFFFFSVNLHSLLSWAASLACSREKLLWVIWGLASLREISVCSNLRTVLVLTGFNYAVRKSGWRQGPTALFLRRALLLLALSTKQLWCRVSIVQLCWSTVLRITTCFSWKWMGVHSSELKLQQNASRQCNGRGEKYSRTSACEKLAHL